MKKHLTRLVYRSKSCVAHDDHAALEALFRTSARNNADNGITGCLAQPDGHFVQVLEGDAGKIERLMTLIEADPRNRDVVVLDKRAVRGRLFEGWAMARPDTAPLSEQSFRIIDQGGSGAQVTAVLLGLLEQPSALYSVI